jgi:hypothetical protein
VSIAACETLDSVPSWLSLTQVKIPYNAFGFSHQTCLLQAAPILVVEHSRLIRPIGLALAAPKGAAEVRKHVPIGVTTQQDNRPAVVLSRGCQVTAAEPASYRFCVESRIGS